MAVFLQDIRQGDVYITKLNFGSANNITGYQFWLTIKEDFDLPDSQAVLSFHTTAGDYGGDDPAHGVAYLVIPPETTKLCTPGNYYYDLQCKTPDGTIITIVPTVDRYKDKVVIAPEVTQGII